MTYDIVNTIELLQIYMRIETKIMQLSQSVWFDLFLKDSKKPAIWQAGKNKRTIIYCLLRKICKTKNEQTLT